MRLVPLRAWAAFALLLVTALPAVAAAPVSVSIGPSRDGVLHDLQRVVDRYFGPGRIDVRTGYIGARAGDPDPWMWTTVPSTGSGCSPMALRRCWSFFAPESHGGALFCAPGSVPMSSNVGPSEVRPAVVEDFDDPELEPQPAMASATTTTTTRARRTVGP